ncbi:hypothetical protein PSQ40_06640 [Curvibacter sp. HBC61]|uniref:Oligosaccharide repeat unit polymerase n=1 Tax=Curvibacter cyanobacteriorum TaxID=3026422 RepID=A0ABT5MWQ6_9BURK|nr:hypothetical protein [Curvibacter sp. HBC61]MDD0838243.1 hypothetical protein [Curvibacter sp. HBC61]
MSFLFWTLSCFSLLLLILAYAIYPVFLFSSLVLHLVLWLQVIVCLSHELKRKVGSYAGCSVVAFSYLFLLIAPSFQLISSDGLMVNTMTISDTAISSANLQFAFFLAGYIFFRKRSPDYFSSFVLNRSFDSTDVDKQKDFFRAIVFLFLSICALGLTYGITSDIVSERVSLVNDLIMSPLYLIKTKFLGFLPIPILLYIIISVRSRIFKSPLWFLVFIFSLLGVLISQNPLLEKRQSIGPVYLSIAAACLFYQIHSGLHRFLYIFSSIVVALPLISIFTHISYLDWADANISMDVIYDHFLETHYDAWANAAGASELTSLWGYFGGQQLVGSILFWVPREIWPDKPVMSGVEIARYLEAFYAMWFDNISAPLATEGFLDFWYLGSFFYGAFLALLCRFLDYTQIVVKSAVIVGLGLYFSFFLVFLLRGALMNAVAYGFGNMLAFILVYGVDQYFGQRRIAQE